MKKGFPPPHKTESLFHRYEKIIQHLCEKFPEEVELDPAPFAPTTFSCRLRDAITSFLEYRWFSKLGLDPLRVEHIRKGYSIIVRGGKVKAIFGRRETESLLPRVTRKRISNIGGEDVFHFAALLHGGYIDGPIYLYDTDPDMIYQEVGSLNVGVVIEKDRIVLL